MPQVYGARERVRTSAAGPARMDVYDDVLCALRSPCVVDLRELQCASATGGAAVTRRGASSGKTRRRTLVLASASCHAARSIAVSASTRVMPMNRANELVGPFPVLVSRGPTLLIKNGLRAPRMAIPTGYTDDDDD
jgi:hypothetical protein